jgi:hypothetical protein
MTVHVLHMYVRTEEAHTYSGGQLKVGMQKFQGESDDCHQIRGSPFKDDPATRVRARPEIDPSVFIL